MNDYANDPRAKGLADVLRTWLASHPNWYEMADESGWRMRWRTAEEVATDLVPVLKKMDVRLAGVLTSPDGQLVRTVVGWVLPVQQVLLINLLVDAVILVAQAQNREQKVKAGFLVGVAVLLIVAFAPRTTDNTEAVQATGRSQHPGKGGDQQTWPF